jgi:four helix bundle protein
MRKPRPHENLKAWSEAIDLVTEVYGELRRFTKDETFGLVSQMRRASLSVPANIAEGAARGTAREYSHFLSIARGSLSELETHLIVSERLRYLPQEKLATLLDRCAGVDRLIQGLSRYQKERLKHDQEGAT